MALALPFCCSASGCERGAGFERAVDFERDVDFELPPFGRAVGFDCAAAFDFAAGLERDELFAERLEALLAFGAEPFDDPLLDLLRGLLVAGLLFAISSSLFSVREHASQRPAYPL